MCFSAEASFASGAAVGAVGSGSPIQGHSTAPKHEIVTTKLRALGMEFGGEALLEKTVTQIVEAARDG